MSELVYFVDEKDKPTGEVAEKLSAHHKNTRLHAAFSCYVFREDGKFLVTKRASSKKVWPDVWTNSCCGHPAPGETREQAIKRRLKYELELKVKDIQVIMPEYIYKTPPYRGIIEHEYCPVYTTIAANEPKPNPNEVSDYKWVDWDWYVNQLKNDSTDYSDLGSNDAPKWSWWAKDQLKKLELVDKF